MLQLNSGKMKHIFEQWSQFDPLAVISRKIFFGSPLFTAIMIGVITLGTEIIMGELSSGVDIPKEAICASYPQVTCPDIIDSIAYNDPAELYFAIFLWGVFAPTVWWYYLSTPTMWKNVIDSFRKSLVVDHKKLIKYINPVLEKSYWLPALGITVFIMVLYLFGSIPSEVERGRLVFWLLTPQGKFLLSFFVFLHTFALISFALKGLFLTLKIRGFFNQNNVKTIYILHVDQCGGFGAIGTLAAQFSYLAILIGFYAVFYSTLPVISGGDFNLGIATLVLYGAYGFLVPFFLVTLTGPVARAMKRYKQKLLMKVAEKLQAELENVVSEPDSRGKTSHTGKDQSEDYKKLREIYEQLAQIPESPIRLLNLKRFTGFAVFPALFGLISFLIDVFDLMSTFRNFLSS